MNADRPRAERVRALFDEVADLSTVERAIRLSDVAGDDPELVAEVERLLGADRGDEAIRNLVDSVAAAFREPQETEGSRVGPYRLVQELGRGGMGTVWLAVRDDEAYHAEVAIKLLRGTTDPGLRTRFMAERQILATLEHPNVARLLDGGTTSGGSPYVVMEYVRGEPIDVYCERRDLTLEARLALFCQVCSAVQAAHQSLIVHRDLKPTNVLVDGEGVPKLLDFGIAKLLAAPGLRELPVETGAASRLLTPRYASPEQIRGGPITTASDIYALGVLLHELLTGCLPYGLSSSDPLELARAICEQEPDPPSVSASEAEDGPRTRDAAARARLARRLEGDLDNIVAKALSKEPRRRYGSPEELAADIRRHLERRPVLARPATFGYHLGRFLSRHRWRVSAAAATAALLIAATLFSLEQMQVAVGARDIAERERSVAVTQALRATLSAASTRIEAQEPLGARAFLESVTETERGWEWHYLAHQLERPVLPARPVGAVAVALPPDGRSVVTMTVSGLVEWRDLVDGAVVRTATIPVQGRLQRAALSGDGTRVALATGAGASRLSVWAIDPESDPRRVLEGSVPSESTGLVLSESGDAVMLTGADASWIWRPGADGPVRIPVGSADAVVTLAADGSIGAALATGSGGSFRILDAARPERAHASLARGVLAVALSPDGTHAATAEMDRVVRVRETGSGRVIGRLIGLSSHPELVAFGPAGRRVATAGPSNVRVWDVESGRVLGVFTGPGPLAALSFGPEGSLLVAASKEGDVRVWRVDDPPAAAVSFARAVARSADGSKTWVASPEGELRALDAASGEWFDVVYLGTGGVTAIVSSSDDRWLATLQEGRAIVRPAISPTSGVPLETGHAPVVGIAFSGADARFATLDADGRAVLRDVDTWAPFLQVRGPPAPDGRIAFSTDGTRLVTTHADGARVWDARSGEQVRLVSGAGRTPTAVAYRPDGRHLAIGWTDGAISLVDLATGEESIALRPHRTTVTALAFAPDGERLASGAEDGTLWVSDPERLSALLELRGHLFRVESLAFTGDGAQLISADRGGFLQRWDGGPEVDRFRSSERLDRARREVEPLVAAMLARSGDASAVAEALRQDASMERLERRAALQIALDPPLPESPVTRDPFDGFAFESRSLDSYIQVGAHDELRMTSSFTVEGWVAPIRPDGEQADPGIILNKEGEYQIARFADGEIAWVVAGPNGWLLPWRRTRYRVPADTWVHVALVRDGTAIRFFVNGRQVQTAEVPEMIGDHHPNMNELRLLGRQHTPSSLRGRIDEIRIWGVARTEEQIRTSMLTRVSGNERGLLAAWSFDEGSGSVARDATGRYPGVLVGGRWTATKR